MTNFTPAHIRIGRRKSKFTTAEAASAAYRAIIDEQDFGASESPNCDLLDKNGSRIGYVSYNGRVWSGDWDAGTSVCIFNPYEKQTA